MKTHVYLAPTKEDWNRIVQKALDEGKVWISGRKDALDFGWSIDSVIYIGRVIQHGNKKHAEQEFGNDPDYILHWPPYDQKTWESLKEGDSVNCGEGLEREVLGVCGKMIFLSCISYKDSYELEGTKEDLIRRGYTLTPPQETITKEEAEKVLGKKIK